MGTATTEQIHTTIARYVERFSSGDRDGSIALFTADATLEDPVGTPVRHGHDEIGEFWDFAHSLADAVRIEVAGPISAVAGEAAWPLRILSDVGGTTMVVDATDVMAFDDAGSIRSMRAFWDLAAMRPLES